MELAMAACMLISVRGVETHEWISSSHRRRVLALSGVRGLERFYSILKMAGIATLKNATAHE
jgi:hypothetical protein